MHLDEREVGDLHQADDGEQPPERAVEASDHHMPI